MSIPFKSRPVEFIVLSDFRKDHGDFFQDCFKQTVKLALELKLASLGHISLGGSKPVLSESRRVQNRHLQA
jgi:hypothetical protein